MFKHGNSSFGDHVIDMSKEEIAKAFAKSPEIDIPSLQDYVEQVKKERKAKAEAEASKSKATDKVAEAKK